MTHRMASPQATACLLFILGTLSAGPHEVAAQDRMPTAPERIARLENDAEPTAYDRLHDAIERGDLTETQWLLERFPRVVNESREGFYMNGDSCYPSALERAVRIDDQTISQLLLKFGADVNPQNGTALLHLVQSAGMAQILIDAGAQLAGRKKSHGSYKEQTPLHNALDVAIAGTRFWPRART